MSIILDLEYKPFHTFNKNLKKIRFIQHIQKDLANCDATKLHLKIHFLNQSYIIQLVAFWQVFIEDLAKYGFRKIEKSEGSQILKTIAKNKLNESLNRFNTPNTKNVDTLFKETLGINKVSEHWQSPELTRDEATNTLSKILDARHSIAHEGQAITPMCFEENFKNMEIIRKIAELTENIVLEELKSALELKK
ncbi:HEPN domain-containing protein [Pseudomonas putida]|uniref:RiboL-PSP-HEPN domain-containing protein n=1 Tax=Pseudomonas putida TaxID=303 RepID=A0A6I6XST0_PSEPU|nr:HEPN domain-containing protein [Pseudomonas putida]QHG67113.1 hypothetical protein C2H86_22970 [Pseudomonas putida]